MGNGLSLLTKEELDELKERTPFDEREIGLLLKRYSQYDKTEQGTEGIPVQTLLEFPELRGNSLLGPVVRLFVEGDSDRLFPQQFLLLCGMLSSKAPVKNKGELLFKSLDSSGSGILGQDEVSRLYRSIFTDALSPQQLQAMVSEALAFSELETPGQITFTEFKKMIPGSEIMHKLTVDLHVS